MLQRQEADGLALISQPAHSWVSGQLARNWGNEQFGGFEPREEVCLSAMLHDIGFVEWEQSPTLNSKTGLPHTFRDLPTHEHFDIWSRSIHDMMRYGRYPALLVSMHFSHLCQKHRTLNNGSEVDHKSVFLKTQEVFQTTLITSLQNDFYYAPCLTPDQLLRNRQLMSVWDWMSLVLCIGEESEAVIDEIPTPNGLRNITLAKLDSGRVRVNPWPFSGKEVQLICEGRRIYTKFADEAKMREALKAAAPVIVKLDLVRA